MKLYDYEALEQIYTSDELDEMESIISRCKRMGMDFFQTLDEFDGLELIHNDDDVESIIGILWNC